MSSYIVYLRQSPALESDIWHRAQRHHAAVAYLIKSHGDRGTCAWRVLPWMSRNGRGCIKSEPEGWSTARLLHHQRVLRRSALSAPPWSTGTTAMRRARPRSTATRASPPSLIARCASSSPRSGTLRRSLAWRTWPRSGGWPNGYAAASRPANLQFAICSLSLCSGLLQMKTVSVALVLCLNVGVDPPDIVKTQPCARLECWIGKFHSITLTILSLQQSGLPLGFPHFILNYLIYSSEIYNSGSTV